MDSRTQAVGKWLDAYGHEMMICPNELRALFLSKTSCLGRHLASQSEASLSRGPGGQGESHTPIVLQSSRRPMKVPYAAILPRVSRGDPAMTQEMRRKRSKKFAGRQH